MNLYLLTHNQKFLYGYYVTVLVAAPSAEVAQYMQPYDGSVLEKDSKKLLLTDDQFRIDSAWVKPKYVLVQHIGKAIKGIVQGVILTTELG